MHFSRGGGGGGACIFNQQFSRSLELVSAAVDWFYDFLNNFIELRYMYFIRDVSYVVQMK